MKLEIQKTLVASSSHITKQDDNLLSNYLREAPAEVIIVDEDFGWKIHICSIVNNSNLELNRLGFSNDFIKCMMLGFINDCEWVLFDCDGPQYEFLNIHEW
jgi:hypothetical protein